MFGDYSSGGHLNLADGRVFEDKRKWRGPYDGANISIGIPPIQGELNILLLLFLKDLRCYDW